MVWGSGFDAADLCAEAGEFFVDVFVASVDVVEAVDFGFALCAEACEDEGGAGAEVAGHDWGTGEVGDAFDDGGGSFEGDLGSHAVEFRDVHEALWEDGFGDDADAWDGGVEGRELSLHIGGEARVGFRADFGTAWVVGAGDCDAVGVDGEGIAAVGEGFEEIGHVSRLAAAEGDPFTGDGTGDEEGTGFDAVWNDRVFGAVEFADAVDDDAACAGTFDAGAHAGEEVGEVFDFWFHGSAFDDGGAFGEDGGHHEVAGAEDRGAVFAAHVDFAAAHAIDGLDVHVAALDVDVGSELFESAKVEVDRAVADDASAGQGDTGFAGAGEEGSHDADGGAHFTDEVVGRFAFDGFSGHHDRAAGPFHVGSEASEDLRHVIGVAEIRHAVNDALVACQQSGCENGKCGVL